MTGAHLDYFLAAFTFRFSRRTSPSHVDSPLLQGLLDLEMRFERSEGPDRASPAPGPRSRHHSPRLLLIAHRVLPGLPGAEEVSKISGNENVMIAFRSLLTTITVLWFGSNVKSPPPGIPIAQRGGASPLS